MHAVCLKWAAIYGNISLILDELSNEEQYDNSQLMDENSKPLLCRLDDGVIMEGNHVMMMGVGHPLLDGISDIIVRAVEAGIFRRRKKTQFDRTKVRARATGICSPLNCYYSFTVSHIQATFHLLLVCFCVITPYSSLS